MHVVACMICISIKVQLCSSVQARFPAGLGFMIFKAEQYVEFKAC